MAPLGPVVKTLDRYLLREWIKIMLLAEIGFPLVVIIIDLTDKLGSYLARGLGRKAVALSYLYYLPDVMFLVLPAAVLFATVFTIGPLGRYSELTAAKASGISFHRLAAPLLIAAGVTVFFGMVMGELAPVGSLRRAELLGERPVHVLNLRYNFVYRADGGWVYAVRSLNVDAGDIDDAILEREGTGPEYPTIDVVASTGRYEARGGDPGWMLHHGAVRYLLGPTQERSFEFDSMRIRAFRERPADLLAEPKAPEEMRFAELSRYINALNRSGSDTRKLRVERALKLAIPCTCLVVALFGAPLAISGPRSGTAWGVAVSLGTTFIFLLLVQLSQAIGGGGVLPPAFAAWLPNILFGGAAVWLLRRTRT
jgi:lipopolysaccharide export system permease protein